MARYASHPSRSRGRRHPEAPSRLRDAFARDRDRVIHSTAFRRLRSKTQVFVAPEGDHFRVRLTHSLEVAQIARTLARALDLNEDLTETIALAHDIGHPPFGHSGEEALAGAMAPVGGFDHNGHTLRILTRLERRTPAFAGLNLSWEVLEGLAKHNGPVNGPRAAGSGERDLPWALAEADHDFPLELADWPSLEAQIASLADDIAYNAHDLDDSLRAGLVDVEDAIGAVPLLADLWAGVRKAWPSVAAPALLVPQLVRDLIGAMVDSLLEETRARLRALEPEFPDDIRRSETATAAFGPAMEEALRPLRAFLRARMYAAPLVVRLREPSAAVVSGLYRLYTEQPERLPPHWRATLPADPVAAGRHVGDYVAGMTDRFALGEYVRLSGLSPIPDDVML
ncbi:deoxyguanosinetriphosphate triphosphohydrolase [Thermaurantiacus sp.]